MHDSRGVQGYPEAIDCRLMYTALTEAVVLTLKILHEHAASASDLSYAAGGALQSLDLAGMAEYRQRRR
jgi:hypothetical protein